MQLSCQTDCSIFAQWGKYIYEEILTLGNLWNWICFFGRRTKKVHSLIPCTLIVQRCALCCIKYHAKPRFLARFCSHAPLLCIALVGMILDPLFGASNYLEIYQHIPLEIYNCLVNIHKEILTAPSMCARMGCGALRSPGAHFAIRFLRGRRSCGWLRATIMPTLRSSC